MNTPGESVESAGSEAPIDETGADVTPAVLPTFPTRPDPATERAARDAAIAEARHRVVRGIRRWAWLIVLLAVLFLAAVWLADNNLGNPFSVTGD